jgi:hypothetical protein
MMTNSLRVALLSTLLLAVVLSATAQTNSAPTQSDAYGFVHPEPPLVCCVAKPVPGHPIPFANPGSQPPISPMPTVGKPRVVPVSTSDSALAPQAAISDAKSSTNTSRNVKTAPVRDPLPKVEQTDNPAARATDGPL